MILEHCKKGWVVACHFSNVLSILSSDVDDALHIHRMYSKQSRDWKARFALLICEHSRQNQEVIVNRSLYL